MTIAAAVAFRGYNASTFDNGILFTTHPQYEQHRNEYELLDDVMAGSAVIKSRNDVYLPVPNHEEYTVTSVRYQQYKQRAIFANITRRMSRTLVGLGYLREPKLTLPPKLKMMEEDVDGEGLSIIQFSKALALEVLIYGRAGILVDYPTITDARRRRALGDRLRPYLKLYKAKEIVNWGKTGGRIQFVVLKRDTEVMTGFNIALEPRWRILQMVGGNHDDFAYGGKYTSRIYSLANGKTSAPVVTPLDYNGNRFERILFHICGAEDNTWDVDGAPMYSVGDLNIGHYRNSADAEEIAFLGGQPTPVISGMDSRQVAANAGQRIELGSRKGLTLGRYGGAVLLQANPNNAPRLLMLDKEITMERLGVQLAVGTKTTGGDKPQTATEVATESLIRNAVLISALQNTSLALTNALKDACLFVGADPDNVNFEVDTSVELPQETVGGAISDSVASANPPKEVA